MDACGAGYHLQIARTTSVDKTLGHSIMGSSQMLLDDSFTNDVRHRFVACAALCKPPVSPLVAREHDSPR